MLNPFPQLLDYGIFAPTLLRLAAALVLFYAAYALVQERRQICSLRLPIVGRCYPWMVWVSAGVAAFIGAALFVGWETQWAAILGMVVAVKHSLAIKQYAPIRPLPQSTYLLLFVICFSLLLTGAGTFAFDVRL